MIEIRHIPSVFPAITLQIQRETQPDVCRFMAQCCTPRMRFCTATLELCSLVSPAQTLLSEPRDGWSEPTIPTHISNQTNISMCLYSYTLHQWFSTGCQPKIDCRSVFYSTDWMKNTSKCVIISKQDQAWILANLYLPI